MQLKHKHSVQRSDLAPGLHYNLSLTCLGHARPLNDSTTCLHTQHKRDSQNDTLLPEPKHAHSRSEASCHASNKHLILLWVEATLRYSATQADRTVTRSCLPLLVAPVRKRTALLAGTADRSRRLGRSQMPPPAAQAASSRACIGLLMRQPTCPNASSAAYTCAPPPRVKPSSPVLLPAKQTLNVFRCHGSATPTRLPGMGILPGLCIKPAQSWLVRLGHDAGLQQAPLAGQTRQQLLSTRMPAGPGRKAAYPLLLLRRSAGGAGRGRARMMRRSRAGAAARARPACHSWPSKRTLSRAAGRVEARLHDAALAVWRAVGLLESGALARVPVQAHHLLIAQQVPPTVVVRPRPRRHHHRHELRQHRLAHALRHPHARSAPMRGDTLQHKHAEGHLAQILGTCYPNCCTGAQLQSIPWSELISNTIRS